MTNYWTKWLNESDKYVDNAYLEALVTSCQQDLETDEVPVTEYSEFAECIERIVKNCWEHLNIPPLPFTLEDAEKRCLIRCWDAVPKFTSKRIKAFNYFSILVLEEFRTMYQNTKGLT